MRYSGTDRKREILKKIHARIDRGVEVTIRDIVIELVAEHPLPDVSYWATREDYDFALLNQYDAVQQAIGAVNRAIHRDEKSGLADTPMFEGFQVQKFYSIQRVEPDGGVVDVLVPTQKMSVDQFRQKIRELRKISKSSGKHADELERLMNKLYPLVLAGSST
jgi:hypothetical protein